MDCQEPFLGPRTVITRNPISKRRCALSEVKGLNGSGKMAPVVMKNSLEGSTVTKKKRLWDLANFMELTSSHQKLLKILNVLGHMLIKNQSGSAKHIGYFLVQNEHNQKNSRKLLNSALTLTQVIFGSIEEKTSIYHAFPRPR